MKRLLLSGFLSGSTAVLITLILSCQSQFYHAGSFSSLQQEELKRIAWMIWDEKPEDQILGAWETFVEREKRSKPNFKDAMENIFEEVKIIAEQNIEFAQEKIRQAQALKKEIDEEMENIRNLRIQYEKSKRFKPFKPKKIEFIKEFSPRTNLEVDGRISNMDELEEYEGYIQWGGMEASLQGTGGVALLEYAKDAIQTAVSNISGIGTTSIKMRKIVERKMGSL